MNLKNLMASVLKAVTPDGQYALIRFSSAFGDTCFRTLPVMNTDFLLEDSGPYLSFELNHVISESYITMIRPQIRDGSFSVLVSTNKMLDDAVLMSSSWEVADDLEEELKFSEKTSVSDVAKAAKELAIAQHVVLLKKVGLSENAAFAAAKCCWRTK